MLSMGKSTISMTLFNSYVMLIYQRVYPIDIPLNHYNYEKLAATDWARSKYFFFIFLSFWLSFYLSFFFHLCFIHFFIILFFIFYHFLSFYFSFFIIFYHFFNHFFFQWCKKKSKNWKIAIFLEFFSFFYHFCFRWWNWWKMIKNDEKW